MFQGAADGRVTLTGDVRRCTEEEVDDARAAYAKAHPDAFWVGFRDFSWWRMETLRGVRYVGGFAAAGEVTAEGYVDASVDPIQAFSAPVIGHMNADHAESTVQMVRHYIGLDAVDEATLTALDRLGMGVQVRRKEQTMKLRLPFPRPAEDRKDVKTLIVEMTRAAAGSAER